VHTSVAQATIADTSGFMALADEAQTLAQAREHRSCKKLVEPPQTKPKKCSGSQPATFARTFDPRLEGNGVRIP
ncbi:MAG: hypothetical protein AAFO79_10395, partial [Pseudomonadota bacterium]